MKGRKIGAAVVAALLLIGSAAFAEQAVSREFARRGADDAEEGGHRGSHHGGNTAPVADAKNGKGKALFEQKCGVCHELSRALNQTKTREGWTSTVKRMQQSNGCQITDAEAAEVVDYLSSVRGKK